MSQQEFAGERGDDMRSTVANLAVPRVGTPEGIAAAIEFLCSPAASYVPGTDLLVDGGATAARYWALRPDQRVHHGQRGHVWFDLDGPALEGLPSAAAARRDGLGAGDAVPGEMAADRLQRGDPLAGHEGPVDPGHPQRRAVGDPQVQVYRTAQVRCRASRPHAPVRPEELLQIRRDDGPGAALAPCRVIHEPDCRPDDRRRAPCGADGRSGPA